MSSYFDKVEGDYYKFQEEDRQLEKARLVHLVWLRYQKYLKYIKLHALKRELPKLKPLLERFKKIPYGDITTLHNFAHDVARAGIRLRGNMRASDNPYWPGHGNIP